MLEIEKVFICNVSYGNVTKDVVQTLLA